MSACREKLENDEIVEAFRALLRALDRTGACRSCQAVTLLENALTVLRDNGWDDFLEALPLAVSVASAVWHVETEIITGDPEPRETLH